MNGFGDLEFFRTVERKTVEFINTVRWEFPGSIVKEGNLIALSQDSTLWIGAMKSLDGSRILNRVRD